MTSHSAQLAAFAAELRFADIPDPVIRKIEDFLVDWFGSAVAGHGSRPVESITRFALAMGPQAAVGCDVPTTGLSEVITRRVWTSPYLAAMAVAQALGASGKQLLTAAVAGYEVGIRVGEFLGRSHYKVFHTTGTAGTLASAAAVDAIWDLAAWPRVNALLASRA